MLARAKLVTSVLAVAGSLALLSAGGVPADAVAQVAGLPHASASVSISAQTTQLPASVRASGRISARPTKPAKTVKLIFIHHSTGENWLADGNGKLGIALKNNNYFVSDTNYGWGPDVIGDRTDTGNWWDWFRGSSSSRYMHALYDEFGQHSSYTRLSKDPDSSRENEIIMFKSCFPNLSLIHI